MSEPASREQALDAVRAFHAEHGRLPRWREWERATASRPCAKTIERRWGWREMLAEALGVQPNDVDVSYEAVYDDRAQAMLAGLRAARDELGRWPTREEWDGGGWRPSSRTFVRHFGGWREACWAAAASLGGLRARSRPVRAMVASHSVDDPLDNPCVSVEAAVSRRRRFGRSSGRLNLCKAP
jgi:Homing endonuclease associated repeat